jgi:hypothetical protein
MKMACWIHEADYRQLKDDVLETGSWLLATGRMRKSLRVIPLIGLIASVGCASVQAKGKPADRPALNVPAPPPRIIEPAPEPPPESVAELPPATPPNRSARPPAARPADPVPPPVEPPASPPAAQLRTPQTSDTSGAAKAVRTTIDTARGILNSVNFAPLTNERKKAYNNVKLFLQQAEDALKEGNLAFAQGVASKAETLAKGLAGR